MGENPQIHLYIMMLSYKNSRKLFVRRIGAVSLYSIQAYTKIATVEGHTTHFSGHICNVTALATVFLVT